MLFPIPEMGSGLKPNPPAQSLPEASDPKLWAETIKRVK